MSDITFQNQPFHLNQNQTNQNIPYQSPYKSSQIQYQDDIFNQYKSNLKSSFINQSLNERNVQLNVQEHQDSEPKFQEYFLQIR